MSIKTRRLISFQTTKSRMRIHIMEEAANVKDNCVKSANYANEEEDENEDGPRGQTIPCHNQ